MKKSSFVFRPATPADAELFYVGSPPASMIAWVAVLDGAPLAIAGLCMGKNNRIGFSEMKPEMLKHKKDILRFARLVMGEVSKYNGFIVFAAEDIPNAEVFLQKVLGLTYIGRTHHGATYIWEAQTQAQQSE